MTGQGIGGQEVGGEAGLAALDYAAAGIPVFPARERPHAFTSRNGAQGVLEAKSPYLPGESRKGAQDGGHWLASAEATRISDWWRRWPRALIGLPTGLRSGTAVIDLDAKEHRAEDILKALAAWCGGLLGPVPGTGELVRPPVSRTQSGGLHVWFAYPAPERLARVEAALRQRNEPWEGLLGNPVRALKRFVQAGEAPPELLTVDVRAEGGYVIAPPSVMEDGRRYEWLLPWRPSADGCRELPEMPSLLLGAITKARRPQADIRAAREAAANAARFRDRPVTGERAEKFLRGRIDAILRGCASAPEGARNQAIHHAALGLGAIVKAGLMGRAEAEALLAGNLPPGVTLGVKERGTIRRGLDSSVVTPLDLRAAMGATDHLRRAG